MFRQTPVAPRMTTRRKPLADGAAKEPATSDVDELELPRDLPRMKLPPVELGPIIKAKIQAPALRESTLSRERLIEQLSLATAHRLTLLIAEAGYGKTTLLADFARVSGLRTLWYRLDPADADLITWTNHIVAAARETEPNFGEATLRLLSQIATGGPPTSAFMSSVISELGDLEPVPTLLVMDDFHAVDESPEAIEFVSRLIRDSPPWLRIVVSSRRRPTLEVGRVAASGELAEISTDDLRFSLDETNRLFAESYGMPLDDDVLQDLDARTRGWVASLQLFHGSIRGRSPSAVRALARALSGANNPIYDFLAEEVLGNLSPAMELFLVRSSLLERISPHLVVALFTDELNPPTPRDAESWLEEGDRLMLLSRSSETSEARQLHPLLRGFLGRHLRTIQSEEQIRDIHLRVAHAVEDSDGLTAAHHFLEAGDEQKATECLGSSVMVTMGSGQWGVASDLIDRMTGATADPAIATIRARRMIDEGQLDDAAEALDQADISNSPPPVRATYRHARLTLGWRTANRELMVQTLAEIQRDGETPPILRDIAQVFVDASPLATRPVTLPSLAKRLRKMAVNQSNEGHYFYSAISLHNASVAFFNAGEYDEAITAGGEALGSFGRLPFFAVEQLSTHTLVSMAHLERGDLQAAQRHSQSALETGREFADVAAELSFAAQLVGRTARASDLLTRAQFLQGQGYSDVLGEALCEAALALVEIERNPLDAVERLERPLEDPLDLGYSLTRAALHCEALLLSGRIEEARASIKSATKTAHSLQARRASVRLAVLRAIVVGDARELESAVEAAAASGDLALLELAEALTRSLDAIGRLPKPLRDSIASYPERWLPLIRRRLGAGNTPLGHAAAVVLDSLGTAEDVGLLRAFAKTYAKRGPGRGLGKGLARRVSPKLVVDDLGRTSLRVSDRTISLTSMRRKPAAVLLYLVTRPGFAVNREQVVDALWGDSDPSSAANNLNQSLYFLRREIDPWFEDDVSVDYVGFQGEIVWLDQDLVAATSAQFLTRAQDQTLTLDDATSLLGSYRAPFAPEFEYEEWAMAWRNRVHATFLELAHTTMAGRIREQDLDGARAIAAHVIQVDEDASDVEQVLVWLYGQLGLHSAARTQYDHLATCDRLDGVEALPFEDLLKGLPPL